MDKEVLSTDSLSWVNKWLSEPRWASYCAVARDDSFALSLYEWNLRLAGALQLEAALRLLNEIRNRAAHHEPFIFQRRREEAQDCLEAVLRLSGLIIPELRQHVREHSKVKLLLDEFPQIIG